MALLAKHTPKAWPSHGRLLSYAEAPQGDYETTALSSQQGAAMPYPVLTWTRARSSAPQGDCAARCASAAAPLALGAPSAASPGREPSAAHASMATVLYTQAATERR
jgi:hypothetical protein